MYQDDADLEYQAADDPTASQVQTKSSQLKRSESQSVAINLSYHVIMDLLNHVLVSAVYQPIVIRENQLAIFFNEPI